MLQLRTAARIGLFAILMPITVPAPAVALTRIAATVTSDIAPAPRHATGAATRAFGRLPEPGTWALVILGFGIVGLSVRRRKSAQVVTH